MAMKDSAGGPLLTIPDSARDALGRNSHDLYRLLSRRTIEATAWGLFWGVIVGLIVYATMQSFGEQLLHSRKPPFDSAEYRLYTSIQFLWLLALPIVAFLIHKWTAVRRHEDSASGIHPFGQYVALSRDSKTA